MAAYYNEFDPYAAQWLRNLVAAGHIAPGDVDERSICDVDSADLAGFTQCHFFAGIGVWSRALRLAGWPDDRPVWTGSCPCQPFSAAGKRGGFDDERHLWPELFRLVRERRPAIVFGEQVASKDGLEWLDTVQADLERAGYASAAADLCAAGIGAPHIRQRLYWVGHAESNRPEMRINVHRELRGQGLAEGCDSSRVADAQHHDGRADEQGRGPDRRTADGGGGAVVRLADAARSGRREERADAGRLAARDRAQRFAAGLINGSGADGLDNNNNKGLEGHGRRHQAQIGHGSGAPGSVAEAGEFGGMAHADMSVAQQSAGERSRPGETPGAGPCGELDGRGELAEEQPAASPTHGHWRDADWLHCRDGKWRPVEPGTFPLAHGAPARVGRLRAYGNAIVPQVAQAFVEAFMECRP